MAHNLMMSSSEETIKRGNTYLEEISKMLNYNTVVKSGYIELVGNDNWFRPVEMREQSSHYTSWSKRGNDRLFVVCKTPRYGEKKIFKEKGKQKELDIKSIVEYANAEISSYFSNKEYEKSKTSAHVLAQETLNHIGYTYNGTTVGGIEIRPSAKYSTDKDEFIPVATIKLNIQIDKVQEVLSLIKNYSI